MAAGDISEQYVSPVTLTVTNLQSLAHSATALAGWTSAVIDNSSDLRLDHLIAGQFVVASSGLSAGEIRVYVIPELYAGAWPDIYSSGTEGTEGTATLHDSTTRDAALRVLWSTLTDTDASRVYPMPQVSLRWVLGFMPRRYILFAAHTTGQNLASSGNGLFLTPTYQNVAAA